MEEGVIRVVFMHGKNGRSKKRASRHTKTHSFTLVEKIDPFSVNSATPHHLKQFNKVKKIERKQQMTTDRKPSFHTTAIVSDKGS